MSGAEQAPLIGVAQFAPALGRTGDNRERAREAIIEAAQRGCVMVVLPECCISGFQFDTRGALLEAAEEIDGPSVREFCGLARAYHITVVGGIAEREGGSIYNTAVLAAPNGDLARYRKCHLFGREKAFFSEGGQLVCYQSPWGIIGLAICYDLWFPEMTRALALAGASLIAVPANWFIPPRQASDEPPSLLAMGVHIAMAAACSNEVVIACADRIGEENGVRFLGQSCIIAPNGRPLAGPASAEGDALLVAPWPDVAGVRKITQSHLASRRDPLYRQSVELIP